MKPGDLIRDLEGHDLGADGAVVVSLEGDSLKLLRLDTEKMVTVQRPGADQVVVDEAWEGTGTSPGVVDTDAIDGGDIHNIRRLPLWWGPRDPNYPSSLTDVIWRPEPRWRRMQQRTFASYGGVRYTTLETGTRQAPRYVLLRTAAVNLPDLACLSISPAQTGELMAVLDSDADYEEKLERANTILDGHGVESIAPEGAYVDRYFQNVIGEYVNMGDAYDATLVYDTEFGEFYITSWGDFLEGWEQENPDQAVNEDEEW